MPFFKTKDGTNLFFSDWGQGAPVVFCASQGLASDVFAPMIDELNARGLRCIALDRRGHGRSDQPSSGYDMDTLAGDIATLVDHLRLERIALIGHSLGGAEAVRYAARLGAKKVRRLILLAPTTPFMTKTDDNALGVSLADADAMRAGWRLDFPKWVADNTQPFFARPVSAELAAHVSSQLLATNLRVVLECSRQSMGTDLRPDLRLLRTPTLILHGDLDASVPLAFGEATAALIAESKLEVFQGAAHGLFLTDSERANRLIAEFIAT